MPYLNHPLVVLTISLRLSAALFILVNPWLGLLLSFVFDQLDSYLLLQKVGYSRKAYFFLDKILDDVTLSAELYVSISTGYYNLLIVLFIYRLIGHFIYLINRDVRVMLFFPNLFEVVFFWFVAAPFGKITQGLSASQFWFIFWVLIVMKIFQEICLHLLWPAYLKKMRNYPEIFRRFGVHNIGY